MKTKSNIIFIVIGKTARAFFLRRLSDLIQFSLLWILHINFFYRARLSAFRPTPNLEDQDSVNGSQKSDVLMFIEHVHWANPEYRPTHF
jgi:hypothetical protein